MAFPFLLDRPTLQFMKVRGFAALKTKPSSVVAIHRGFLESRSSPQFERIRPVSSQPLWPQKNKYKQGKTSSPTRRVGKTVSKPSNTAGDTSNDNSLHTQEELDRQQAQAADVPPFSPQAIQSSQKILAEALASTDPAKNDLIAPVHIPEDPKAVLKPDHPAAKILTQSGMVIKRQLELANVLVGFEVANRYEILSPHGTLIGYLAEEEGNFRKGLGRQLMTTHRPFRTHVFDEHGTEVLRFDRPFSAIKSKIRVYDAITRPSNSDTMQSEDEASSKEVVYADTSTRRVSDLQLSDMQIIGEAHSQWDLTRRKYNLYLAHELSESETISEESPKDLSAHQQAQTRKEENFAQFAYVSEPMLSWSFNMKDADDKVMGTIDRNWGGFGREFFTDTGAYVLRMDAVTTQDPAMLSNENAPENTIHNTTDKQVVPVKQEISTSGMTLDQRAVLLATAVTIDYDYFSRHSGIASGGFMPMPIFLPMGGGGGAAAEGAAVGGMVGAGEIATGEMAAGAVAGAGSIAGYEAMQRQANTTDGAGMAGGADGMPPMYEPTDNPADGASGDVWGSDEDPWSNSQQNGGSGGDAGQGGGEGGGGWLDAISDFFTF